MCLIACPLIPLYYRGELSPPATQVVALAQYREALDKTLKGFLPAKYVFDMQQQ